MPSWSEWARRADTHAAACPDCRTPTLDRPWAGCPTGWHIDQRWGIAWRQAIQALTRR